MPDAWYTLQYQAKIKKIKNYKNKVIYESKKRLEGSPRPVQVPDMIKYTSKFIKGHKIGVKKLQQGLQSGKTKYANTSCKIWKHIKYLDT